MTSHILLQLTDDATPDRIAELLRALSALGWKIKTDYQFFVIEEGPKPKNQPWDVIKDTPVQTAPVNGFPVATLKAGTRVVELEGRETGDKYWIRHDAAGDAAHAGWSVTDGNMVIPKMLAVEPQPVKYTWPKPEVTNQQVLNFFNKQFGGFNFIPNDIFQEMTESAAKRAVPYISLTKARPLEEWNLGTKFDNVKAAMKTAGIM